MTKATPQAIVKRGPQEFADWLSTEPGFLSGLCTIQNPDGSDEPLRLEPYQTAFLRDRSSFRLSRKSRQVGMSYLMAGEAIARAHLRAGHRAVFVSYNMDDSKEKIAYAREIYESLPLEFQKPLRDGGSKSELAFLSPTDKRPSRIISNPSRAPRGKGKADIYLDEIAHYGNDKEVYTGSTALIVRGVRAQITLCSSPLGRRGVFWEIDKQEFKQYRAYTRQFIPWWLSRHLCDDVHKAALDAPSMATADRVARFGRQNIKDQFESLTLDDFQQEYEAKYLDDQGSYFPYSLITPCTFDRVVSPDDFSGVEEPRGRLVAGYDVARTDHDIALSLFDERDSGMHDFRGMWTWKDLPFAEQEANLRMLIEMLPIARLRIDKTGMGMQLAENLERDYDQVEGVAFTNENKATMARDLKILMQQRRITLPCDRGLVTEIHSIRKRITTSGRAVFEPIGADEGTSAHADRFWSIALATGKDRGGRVERTPLVSVRIVGIGTSAPAEPADIRVPFDALP